jgi:hypothetical protein
VLTGRPSRRKDADLARAAVTVALASPINRTFYLFTSLAFLA